MSALRDKMSSTKNPAGCQHKKSMDSNAIWAGSGGLKKSTTISAGERNEEKKKELSFQYGE